ncbi:MAG: inositol 2-dehydrogenase [Myxococcota bacterium]|nr:inositol 2-dehydrogenase [Myxococcota bacterium]
MTAGAIGLGVLGVGRIGQIHARNIATRIPGARLAALYDPRPGVAEELSGQLGGTKTHSSEEDLMADPAVDAVVICSSTDTHARLIEAAAAAGRPIFCEKPISIDLDTVDRALEAVDRAGVPLQIGFNRRFDPNFREVRRAVQAGEIGTPEILRITSRDPGPPPLDYIAVSGGLFFDMTIHDFDMARYQTGSEPRSVYAVAGVRVDPRIGEAGDVDTAVVTIEFENGVYCTIDNSRRAAYGYDQRLEFFGSKGMARAENDLPHRATLSDETGVRSALPLHFFLERYQASFQAELLSFVEALHSGRAPEVGGKDGRVPVLMARAANRSVAERRPVSLEEVDGG